MWDWDGFSSVAKRFIYFFINDMAQTCSSCVIYQRSTVTPGIIFYHLDVLLKFLHFCMCCSPASKSPQHHNTVSTYFGWTSSQLTAAAASLKASSLFRAGESQCPGINDFTCPRWLRLHSDLCALTCWCCYVIFSPRNNQHAEIYVPPPLHPYVYTSVLRSAALCSL